MGIDNEPLNCEPLGVSGSKNSDCYAEMTIIMLLIMNRWLIHGDHHNYACMTNVSTPTVQDIIADQYAGRRERERDG